MLWSPLRFVASAASVTRRLLSAAARSPTSALQISKLRIRPPRFCCLRHQSPAPGLRRVAMAVADAAPPPVVALAEFSALVGAQSRLTRPVCSPRRCRAQEQNALARCTWKTPSCCIVAVLIQSLLVCRDLQAASVLVLRRLLSLTPTSPCCSPVLLPSPPAAPRFSLKAHELP